MKVYPKLPDNCTVVIEDSKNIRMTVSVNIPKEVAKYLPPRQVGRGRKFSVYFESQHLNGNRDLYETYRFLLNKAMVETRKAKVKLLNCEIGDIQLKLF